MSLHFSSNQYDKNFNPKLLQNWEVPRNYRERPRSFLGFTQIVANDRGHLLSGVKRSRESPWGTFVGTYDIPLKIPGNSFTNSTARADLAIERLERMKSDGDIILQGKLKKCNIPSPLPVKADKNADKTLTPKVAATQLAGSPNGLRSGAMNHAGVTAPASPGIRTPYKPSTPNIDWPRPESQRSRQKSASPHIPPNVTPKSPLPAIQSPTPGSPAPLKWPAPQPCEDPTLTV